MTANQRRAALAGIWLATLVILTTAIARVRHLRASPDPLPDPGALLPLDSIRAAFDLEPMQADENWLLVLTSSCPFCLALGTELDSIREAAECKNAELLPLVVEFGMPTDSMKSILTQHQLVAAGESGPNAF